jgi:hypothetical protein
MSDNLNDSTQEMLQSLEQDRNLTENILLGQSVLVGQSDTLIKLHSMLEKSVKSSVEDAKLEIISAVQMLNWTKTTSNWDSTWMAETKEQSKKSKNNKTKEHKEMREDFDMKNAFKASVFEILQFSAMSERLDDIPEAHKSTFRWAYSTSGEGDVRWDSFSDWLSQEKGIYWIQGKPGSGMFSTCIQQNYH